MKLAGSTRPSPPPWRRRGRKRPSCAIPRRKSTSSSPSRQKRTLKARSQNILRFLNSMVSLFELFLQPFKINVYRNYCLEWVVSFCLFFKWHIWFGKPCHVWNRAPETRQYLNENKFLQLIKMMTTGFLSTKMIHWRLTLKHCFCLLAHSASC